MIHHPRLGGLARPAALTVRGLALRALAKRARQPGRRRSRTRRQRRRPVWWVVWRKVRAPDSRTGD